MFGGENEEIWTLRLMLEKGGWGIRFMVVLLQSLLRIGSEAYVIFALAGLESSKRVVFFHQLFS